jgi:phospholipase/carboxylesterase
MSLANFHYLHQDNSASKTVVLLHGTGGNEHDLLPLIKQMGIVANTLSLRGNVVENGMNRFFKRSSPGVFDERNIKQETEKLRQFMTAFLDAHHRSVSDLIYLGYSNGANMILALLLLHPEMVNTAILLHPMLPLWVAESNLQHAKVIVTYGENDQMITPQQTQIAVATLREKGASVEVFSHAGGHEITQEEVEFVSLCLSTPLLR